MKITPVGADTYLWWTGCLKHWAESLVKNKFSWHLLQKCAVWNESLEYHTHLQQCVWSSSDSLVQWFKWFIGAAVFLLDPWTKQSVKNQALLSMRFGKTSIKFLVPSLNISSWFHSYLRTPSVHHRMNKSCFNSHCQKNFFSKSRSPDTRFPRNVFLFHSQNIGIVNWQLWSSIKSNR